MVKSPEKNDSSQAREAKTTDENSSPRRERSVRLSLPELQEASVLDMFEHSTRTVSTRNMDSLHSLPSLAYYDGSLSDDDDDDMAAIEVVPHRRSLTSNPGGSRKDKGLRCSTASQKTVPCSNRTENDEVCCDEESGDKDLSTLGKFRKVCGDLINHAMVQHAIILLICLNALMMGIATFDFVEDDEHVSRVFEIADTIFLITFTIESAMQLTYHGVNLFKDGWLVFDFTVVVLSWSLESFQIVRAFRIFRTLRLVARLESLRKIVSALGNVIPSLSAVLFLLILVMYIFAVLCTELFGELPLKDNYFGSLDVTLFSLFDMMLLEWSEIAREVMEHYYWAWLPFTVFLVFTSFILFSLVVAVVCDAVAETEHGDEDDKREEEETANREKVIALREQVETLTKSQRLVIKALGEALQEVELLRGQTTAHQVATTSSN